MPTRVQEIDIPFSSHDTATVTSSTFSPLSGDTLTAYAVTSDGTADVTLTNNGTALVWTLEEHVFVDQFCRIRIWSTVLSADRPSLTITYHGAGTGTDFGGGIVTWRNAVIGTSGSDSGLGPPVLPLSMGYADSSILVVVGDWDSGLGTSRVWRTSTAGTLTEMTYFRDTGWYSVYIGYHADAGQYASQTVGMTVPDQKFSIAALEIATMGAGSPDPDPDVQTDVIQYTKAR